MGHGLGDQYREEDRAQLEPVEDERHRERPEEQRDEHQHRRGEQRDLRARADRDVDRQVHLVARREVDRHPVLGGVADDRDDDDADEERRQPDRLRRLGDRADEDLRHHADGDAGAGEHQHGLAHRPRLALVLVAPVLGVEEVLVRLEREEEPGEVGDEQDDRDGDREVLDVAAEVDRLLLGPRQAAAGHELEDRRHHQRGGRQHQHQRLHPRRRAVELLALALAAADQHRGAHHEQDVAEDRADQRGLDDLLEALVQGEEGDDDLGRVAEGDVEEAADARPRAHRELLGRLAHQRRGRDHAGRRAREDHGRLGVRELERDRDRDERDEEVRPPLAAQEEAAQALHGAHLT